jgi:hypothetical protein
MQITILFPQNNNDDTIDDDNNTYQVHCDAKNSPQHEIDINNEIIHIENEHQGISNSN